MTDDPTPIEPIVIVETHTHAAGDGHGHVTFDETTTYVVVDDPAVFGQEGSKNIGGRGEPPIETKPTNWGREEPAEPEK